MEGRISSDPELANLEMGRTVKYTDEQKYLYKTIGGTPFLDQNYTVFGEIESGLEVLPKIANVQKDQSNRPMGDIRMYIEIVK